jgi:hypothetical protein
LVVSAAVVVLAVQVLDGAVVAPANAAAKPCGAILLRLVAVASVSLSASVVVVVVVVAAAAVGRAVKDG